MEQGHRDLILQNINKLIEYTDYKKLIEACINEKIISPIMMKNIENLPEADEKTKHRALFEKLTRRGPEAFSKLHQILLRLGRTDAANILDNNCEFVSLKEKKAAIKRESLSPDKSFSDGCISTKIINDNNGFDFNNSTTKHLKIYTKEVPQNFQVIKSTKLHVDGEDKVSVYSMRKKENRGILFMVNNIYFPHRITDKRRNGAEIDRDNMVHLFREFGFTIFYYENTTLKEFHELLDELLNSNYIKETECFILALMTHGNMTDGIEKAEFCDNSVEDVNVILEKFRNNVCKNLIYKPKIFFFPYCRGDISDTGTYGFKAPTKRAIESDGISVKLKTNIASYSDMLLCYATVPGYKVHRDPDAGSWYIQTLCEIFAKHAHNTHIEDLLKIVGFEASKIRAENGKLQTANFNNYGFYKKLYFNPGYYDT